MLTAFKCTSNKELSLPFFAIYPEKGLLYISSLSSSPPEPNSTRCWLYFPEPQRKGMKEMKRELGIYTIIRSAVGCLLLRIYAQIELGSISECAKGLAER